MRLFDAALLTWLTSVPPDRVGVARKLRLGGTLKPKADGGFALDLSTPDAHKTAAAFGPSVSDVPAPAAKLLAAWLRLAGLGRLGGGASPPYVFVLGASGPAGHAQPVPAKRWTKVVQAAFKRHAGVPLAPKDLRSSFVTFLMSEQNTDATLKSAAFAMRHSRAQQAGPAYDKERAVRLSAAAVRVAGAHAARF